MKAFRNYPEILYAFDAQRNNCEIMQKLVENNYLDESLPKKSFHWQDRWF